MASTVMDFRGHQEISRSRSAKLFTFFALGVIGIVLVLGGLVSSMFFLDGETSNGLLAFAIVAPTAAVGVVAAAMTRSAQIRQGGGDHLARSLGGSRVNFNTKDPAEEQLVNVVEEIAIASGLPVPNVFVMHDEPGINAFAAGWNADNASIGVTRGALQHLSRQELQGVIAHEFSHIANGDTRIKTRIIGLIYGITAMSILGAVMMRLLRRGRRSESKAIAIVGGVGLALIIAGFIGAWFGKRMQAAVSREREHLADASAVQYTRDPDGLAGALLKIGSLGQANKVINAHAEDAGHLFFHSPLSASGATHPPLDERIRKLLPNWNGKYPKLSSAASPPGARVSHQPESSEIVAGAVTLAVAGATAAATDVNQVERIESPTFGPPSDEHIAYARQLLASIPAETKELLHTRTGAVAAVVGLLASEDPTLRVQEFERISIASGFDVDYLSETAGAISDLDRTLHLVAVDIALHSIRNTPDRFHDTLLTALRDIGVATPEADLFQWTMKRVVLRHLEDVGDDGSTRDDQDLASLAMHAGAVYAVLSTFNGDEGAVSQREAFLEAHKAAGLPLPRAIPTVADASARLEVALDELGHLSFGDRIAFVEGAVAAAHLDKHTTPEEAELIRVVADAVRLPMPPILPAHRL